MKISIVIPAFNEEKLLTATLNAIKTASEAFHDHGWLTEIIVADNHSTDHTAEMAKNLGATVVHEPINSIARARNCGAGAATGDWLIFVDADSLPSRELFAAVVRAIQSGRVLGGGALVRFDHAVHVFGLLASYFWNAISRLFQRAAGSFIFCQAAAFRQMGGFDPNLFAAEEIRFSRRLINLARQQGKQFRIITRVSILTSSRKLRLYSSWELFTRIARMALFLPFALHSREACSFWYDGRR